MINEIKAERPSVMEYELYDDKGHIETFTLTLQERLNHTTIQCYCQICKKVMRFKP